MIKRYILTLIGMAILIGVISISLVSADTSATIDFEGLAEGAIVTSLSCGSGITCTGGDIAGSVSVNAFNPKLLRVPKDTPPDSNTAMIFDAECVGGCSGSDIDLLFPGHGKTLINSEDLDSSDPDDQANIGSFIEFDFAGFPGIVTISSIDVGDIELREDGAFVEAHAGPCSGHPLPPGENEKALPITGNNVITTTTFSFVDIECLHVHLNGSGTIDNIEFTVGETPVIPAITIEKATNEADADTPTGPVVPVGSTVIFTYLVTNTGDVALTGVSVLDDKNGVVPCPQTILAVGESMTCTGNKTATPGQYANSGTACGNPTGPSARICDTDPSHHFGASPAIDIEKATNGPGQDPEDADTPDDADVPEIGVGQTVTWTYTVTNTGNFPFDKADVVVEDDIIGLVTFIMDNGNNDDLLDPGETWIYQATGDALDLDNDPEGVNINIVDGCGEPPRPTYQNKGVVTAPGATDEDPSHYCNPESIPAFARITGGGWRVTGSDGDTIHSTGGFTLHCDIVLSNNLQISWGNSRKWHIDKFVDAAFCKDDPGYTPEPPVAPADTYFGLDVGKLDNNAEGSVACFKLEDHGETSSDLDGADQALIRIWAAGYDPGITAADLDDDGFDCLVGTSDPTNDPNTVLYVPESDIRGNYQFHFDQPHRDKN